MKPLTHVGSLALTAIVMVSGGCARDSISAEEERWLRDDYVRLDGVQPRPADDFSALEARAHAGVDPHALSKALAGNRLIPRAIAESFARSQRMSEARYWLQIGAENGDGISMQQLSITLRKENCRRANYWLERALKTGHLPGLAQSDAARDLAEYRKACP